MTTPISPTILSPHYTETIGVPVYIKPEIHSPTGSYKDRMATEAIEESRAAGATKVVLTSSGNQGVAIAYAAQAVGMPCLVVSTKHILPIYREELNRLGAELELTPDMKSRSACFHERVAEGYFPLSVVPEDRGQLVQAGKSGYAAIAREIVDELGKAPEFLILPSCFGDGCTGIFEGLSDSRRRTGNDHSKILSAAGHLGCGHRLFHHGGHHHAGSRLCRENANGRSIFYQHEDFVKAEQLAREEGFDVEPCSAIPLLAVQRLHAEEPDLFTNSTIVLLLTARSRPGTTPA